MTHTIEEMKHKVDEQISIEDGGYVNERDAIEYANTGYDMELIFADFQKLLTKNTTDTLARVREIVGKWIETSNPAHAQDLFDALTPTPLESDKTEEV